MRGRSDSGAPRVDATAIGMRAPDGYVIRRVEGRDRHAVARELAAYLAHIEEDLDGPLRDKNAELHRQASSGHDRNRRPPFEVDRLRARRPNGEGWWRRFPLHLQGKLAQDAL